ncbi:ferredoxin reductase [Streptomyces sp. WI04-05B]|uniref:ferredoxin reductase n=1 Tax=Streptomyces TaxID=1883 RepID=UPI0029B7859F|nr:MULTISPECIES: ferredoxin reductase [unclassified Streptomyces]MDX2541709.1 ferredoxin reductase [Streptomyces sp. WI04-05B]MDX2583557.1 ferredoxin reductase [Streptomyces sp. WI04-05A]MDX3745335.1 ferredoxin reductase [Streptomyces sp. AK08-02]
MTRTASETTPPGAFVPPTRFAVPGRIAVSNRAAAHWQTATLTEVRRETPHASTFRFAVPGWAGHLPGQHLMLRLTADDGYTAQRHYSIASPPDDAGHIELTLDHVEDGEVSGWFHTLAKPGDEVEVRGPLSGFFAWPGDRPALLLGAGSGVVPLMSMIRHHRARGLTVPLRLLVSARGPEELIYAREYGAETTPVFTRRAPEGVPVGRLAASQVTRLLADGQPPGGWEAYVCGSNAFAEHASRLLVAAGQPVDRIRIERFG